MKIKQPTIGVEIIGKDVRPFEVFLLYTAEQQFKREDCPKVSFTMREVKRDEFMQFTTEEALENAAKSYGGLK